MEVWGKYKLGVRAGKYKLGARTGKYKLEARTGKYKFGARGWARGPATKERAGCREIQIPNIRQAFFLCCSCLFVCCCFFFSLVGFKLTLIL